MGTDLAVDQLSSALRQHEASLTTLFVLCGANTNLIFSEKQQV